MNLRQEAPPGGATPAVAPALTPGLPGPCTSQLTSNPLEWVHGGGSPKAQDPLPGGDEQRAS